jgi:phage terminase large subunit
LTDPRARYLGAWGGRGSGKSHFFAEQLIGKAIYKYNKMGKGLRWACLREIQKSLSQSVKLLLEDKIKAMGVGHYFDVREDRIKTPGGGLFLFQGMQNHTAESIKSLEDFDGAWFEEAQKASERSLTLLRPTIRKFCPVMGWSQIMFSWNAQSEKDAVEKLLRPRNQGNKIDPRLLPERAVVVKANYMDNPFFWDNPVLVAEMKYDRRRDYERFKHVWLGHYQTRSEARVFKNIVVQDFDTPKGMRYGFGCDWGFAQDPTVLLRGFEAYGGDNKQRLYIDREAWGIGIEIDHTPAFFAGSDLIDGPFDPDTGRVTRVLRTNPRWQNPRGYKGVEEALLWPIIADSSDPQNISYMRRHGFDKMVGAIKGPNSVEQGITFLQKYEEIVIHETLCPHAADEFQSYSYKIDKQTDLILNELQQDKNHTIDSGRYMVEPKRRNVNGQAGFARY